jgi:hypothetical protein
MSIKIHVTPSDLLETRFAYNPLIELSISYRILGKPEWHHLYPKWVDDAQRALHGIKLPFMQATIRSDVGYIPDFLTPTPTVVQLSLEHEIQRMLANPDDLVRKNIQRLIEKGGESDILQFFLTHPQEALLCLAEELRLYWRRALEPYWSSLTAVLDGDVIYHARQMALYGPEQMFNGLEARALQYRDGVIELAKSCYEVGSLDFYGLRHSLADRAGMAADDYLYGTGHRQLATQRYRAQRIAGTGNR